MVRAMLKQLKDLRTMIVLRPSLVAGSLVLALVAIAGCGRIVDPDNIVVAELDGEPVRQRDLFNYLRRLSEVDRPLIQTREDAVDALNAMINAEILDEHAEALKELGQIQVPRELAKEAYFQKYPEFRDVYEIPDARLIDRDERDLEAIRAQVEFGIDDEEARLYREAALTKLAQDAYAAGRIDVTDEELRAEYTSRREALRHDQPSILRRNERIEFIGIRFPETMPDHRAKAAELRRRIDADESFDAIVEEFRAKDPSLILESEFENDPLKPKFRTFWDVVSGSEPGTIHLAFLPEFTVRTVAGGREHAQAMPASHIVLRVESHSPERIMSFEEARSVLRPYLLREKMMAQLRARHGVAVFPEKLHDPAGFGDQFKDAQIETTLN